MRNILTQSWSGLDFTSVFDERRIVLADLSGVGGTNARLLGSLLLLLIRQAAFARDASGSGAQHFILVDEASWFVSRTISELYDQARKFNIGLVLAVQRLGQLTPDDVREAVLANAGTFATFRVQEHDEAILIARRLASFLITSSDLQRLPNFEAYVQAGRQAGHHEPSWLRTIAPKREQLAAPAQEQRLLLQGRELYARPRELVEADLRRHAALTTENDEPEIRSFSIEETAFSANAA